MPRKSQKTIFTIWLCDHAPACHTCGAIRHPILRPQLVFSSSPTGKKKSKVIRSFFVAHQRSLSFPVTLNNLLSTVNTYTSCLARLFSFTLTVTVIHNDTKCSRTASMRYEKLIVKGRWNCGIRGEERELGCGGGGVGGYGPRLRNTRS